MCVGCFRWNARVAWSSLNKLWRNYTPHEFLDGNKGYTLFLITGNMLLASANLWMNDVCCSRYWLLFRQTISATYSLSKLCLYLCSSGVALVDVRLSLNINI